MANILKSSGVTISVETSTGPSVYTAIANCTKISGFKHSTDSEDNSVLGDTIKMFYPGLPDAGKITVEFLFDPDDTTHALMKSQSLAPVSKNWKIALVDATPSIYSFTGWVSSFEDGEKEPGKYARASFEIQITSTPTVGAS